MTTNCVDVENSPWVDSYGFLCCPGHRKPIVALPYYGRLFPTPAHHGTSNFILGDLNRRIDYLMRNQKVEEHKLQQAMLVTGLCLEGFSSLITKIKQIGLSYFGMVEQIVRHEAEILATYSSSPSRLSEAYDNAGTVLIFSYQHSDQRVVSLYSAYCVPCLQVRGDRLELIRQRIQTYKLTLPLYSPNITAAHACEMPPQQTNQGTSSL